MTALRPFAIPLVVFGMLVIAIIVRRAIWKDDSTASAIPPAAPMGTVRVESSFPMDISGSVGTLGSSRSVEGSTPATFTVPAVNGVVSAFIQRKNETPDTMVVTVSCGSQSQQQRTSAAYGVVTLAVRC